MTSKFETSFYLVFHDPFLRQRIFYFRRPYMVEKPGDTAARLGYLAALVYAPYRLNCSWGALSNAIRHGHLDVLKWLHANEKCSMRTEYMVDSAASNGHLRVLQWLFATFDDCCARQALKDAAFYDNLDIVQWLHATYFPEEELAMALHKAENHRCAGYPLICPPKTPKARINTP